MVRYSCELRLLGAVWSTNRKVHRYNGEWNETTREVNGELTNESKCTDRKTRVEELMLQLNMVLQINNNVGELLDHVNEE